MGTSNKDWIVPTAAGISPTKMQFFLVKDLGPRNQQNQTGFATKVGEPTTGTVYVYCMLTCTCWKLVVTGALMKPLHPVFGTNLNISISFISDDRTQHCCCFTYFLHSTAVVDFPQSYCSRCSSCGTEKGKQFECFRFSFRTFDQR